MIENGNLEEATGKMMLETGAVSIAPALLVKPKNIEAARKYGLHQWFTISFDKGVKPQVMAEKLAGYTAVRSVQYNKYVRPVRAEEVYPFEAMPLVKNDPATVPFDDPYVSHQWNLVNDGSIAAEAVAGADVGVKDAWRLT